MQNQFCQIEEAPATRILSRQREMHPQRLNLNLVIVEMTRALEQSLGPDIAMEIECEQDLPPILGVLNMVKLALMDLATIARVELQRGGKILIRTSVRVVEESFAGRPLDCHEGTFVCLEVRHNSASSVWSEETWDSASRLATVYGIAQQHCGWLDVSREAADGTSFNLFFPVAARTESWGFGEDRSVEIPGGHETILLVEDELDLLALTREILERYGYRIIAAPNGRAALKMWAERRNEIDLLLTDMRMPEGINGYELAERLLSEKPMLKVIYVSGYSIEPGPRLRLEEGQNFLTKPYTPPGLANAVRRMLDCVETAQAA